MILSAPGRTLVRALFVPVLLASPFIFAGCSRGNGTFAISNAGSNSQLRLVRLAHISQRSYWDCGIGALAMVYRYWGDRVSYPQLTAELSSKADSLRGLTSEDMRAHARRRGYQAFILRTDVNDVREQINKGRPVIVCRNVLMGLNHFEVVYGYDRTTGDLLLDDPGKGPVRRSARAFESEHEGTGGFALLIVPKAGSALGQAAL